MKWNFKREMFALAMILLLIAVSIYYYGILPESIPSHFNNKGMPDNYSSKQLFFGISIGAAILIYIILTFIPFFDPFWKRIQNKYYIFLLFRDLAVGFTVFLTTLSFISAKEGMFKKDLFGIGFGLLFILMGNYLPRLPRNFFFGIRSPWTLASDVVWYKTHRVSGGLFVAAGIFLIILNLSGVDFLISMLAVILPVIIFSSVIYPFVLFKKLQKEGGQKENDL